MSIFGPDMSVPSVGGWDTSVTPGGADPNNMSLAEKLRLNLFGNTDKTPQSDQFAGAMKAGAQTFGQSPMMGGAKPAAAAPAAPGAPPPAGGGLAGVGQAVGRIMAPFGPAPGGAAPLGGPAGPGKLPEAAAMPGSKKPHAGGGIYNTAPFSAG